MSGRGETADGTELEAAARRLAALADRLRALRAQLEVNAGHAGSGSVPAGHTPDGDGAKGEAR